MSSRNILSGGHKTTYNGDRFEKKVIKSFEDSIVKEGLVIEEIKKISTSKTQKMIKIYNGDELLGFMGTQNTLFSYLNVGKNWDEIIKVTFPKKDVRQIWSKYLRPDVFIFDVKSLVVHVIESKYQNKNGSVDEKIQTAPYKLHIWKTLLSQWNIGVTYEYVLGTEDFWNKTKKNSSIPIYKDIFDYLDGKKIKYTIFNTKTTKYNIWDYLTK